MYMGMRLIHYGTTQGSVLAYVCQQDGELSMIRPESKILTPKFQQK